MRTAEIKECEAVEGISSLLLTVLALEMKTVLFPSGGADEAVGQNLDGSGFPDTEVH